MARGWVQTVHKDGAWHNEIEGEGVLSSHYNKDQAVAKGRELVMERRTEHLSDNLDGTIAERNSYGGDPYPPRG
jgi:hypothetical protein